jgi:hypothetical protein
MCHQALQRAQTCCIICRNGNRFLHEEGTCCWAMHGYQKGRSRIRGCRKPPCVPPGLNGLFAERASGGRWDRPELHRLFDQLRPRDVVVVWKLDRLSRSLKDLLHLMERIAHAGAGFRSLTEAMVAYLGAADNVSGPLASRLSSVNQPVIRTRNAFSTLLPSLLADI